MCVPTNGELYSSDTACSGDIVILPMMFAAKQYFGERNTVAAEKIY